MDLFTGKLSGAVKFFTVSGSYLFVRCRTYQKCCALARKAGLKQSAKTTVHAGTAVKLSVGGAQAAVVVAIYFPEMDAADPLCFLPERLRMYHCLSQGVLECFKLPYQTVEFAVLHGTSYASLLERTASQQDAEVQSGAAGYGQCVRLLGDQCAI